MKKQTLALLLVLSLLGSLPPVVAGATSPRVVVSSATVSTNSTFVVTVAVENVVGLIGYQFSLSYNPAILTIVDADSTREGIQIGRGNVFAQIDAEPPIHATQPGTIVYYAVSGPPGGGAPVFSGTGILATITFRANVVGQSPLTLSDVVLSNRSGEPITSSVQSGLVSASTPPPIIIPPPVTPPPITPPPVTPLQNVSREASPLVPSQVSFDDATTSVLVPAHPLGTIIFLRQVAADVVTPQLGTNRLVGVPFEFIVERNNQPLAQLDTVAVLEVRVPGDGAIPGNLGLYYFNAEHRVWVRVVGDFHATTRAFVVNTPHLGLYALLVDPVPPAMLTSVTPSAQGRDVTLSGMAEPLATIHLFADSQFVGAFNADIRGNYRFTVPFPVGRHAVSLRQIDQAGNVSSQSLELSITADWALSIELVLGSSQSRVNNQVAVLDVPPRIVNGRTMVPLRFITEALGAEVTWNATTNTINVQLDTTQVVLTIGSRTALVNGKPVTLDVAPLVERGRTLVPVRFISETFGCEVVWHGETNRIDIRR